MEHFLSEQQKEIKKLARTIAEEKILPVRAALDEKEEFPREIMNILADTDMFRVFIPEEYDGLGGGCLDLCLVVEELSRICCGVAVSYAAVALGVIPIIGAASEELKQKYLPDVASGKKLAAFAVTEPNAGSDLGGLATSATKVDGGYVLNGQKIWVTAAPIADFFTVFARVGEEKLLTIFLVERDFEGLKIGRNIDKMGVWALPTSELALDECFVPDSHRLSAEEGDGEDHLRKLLSEIRIVTGALALGVARAALDEAIRYAGERQQFGKPINRFQAIQLKLAEMATDLEAARHLVYHAAVLKDQDKPHRKEASMAKMFASEAAATICEKTARIFASYGYAMEYPVQRFLRDVRFTLIGGGTSDILKLIIAKELST